MNNISNTNFETKPHIRFKTTFNLEPDHGQHIFLLRKNLLKTILKKMQKLRTNYSADFRDTENSFLTLIVYINEFFVLRIFNRKLLVTRNGISELLIDEHNTVQNSILKSVIGSNYDFIVKLLNISSVFSKVN